MRTLNKYNYVSDGGEVSNQESQTEQGQSVPISVLVARYTRGEMPPVAYREGVYDDFDDDDIPEYLDRDGDADIVDYASGSREIQEFLSRKNQEETPAEPEPPAGGSEAGTQET